MPEEIIIQLPHYVRLAQQKGLQALGKRLCVPATHLETCPMTIRVRHTKSRRTCTVEMRGWFGGERFEILCNLKSTSVYATLRGKEARAWRRAIYGSGIKPGKAWKVVSTKVTRNPEFSKRDIFELAEAIRRL